MTEPAPGKKKHGCLKAIVILLVLFGVIKGCSAYRNRPAALYERWLGHPVPEDVTNLEGGYKFYLTEPIAWLQFKAPPSRIHQIVEDNGMILIKAIPHWSIPSDSRIIVGGNYEAGESWIGMSAERTTPIPSDLEIYWIGIDPDSKMSGWFLYYSPATQEAYYNFLTT